MTEADWSACTDPTPMLEFLQGRTSERKLRLFACACFSRLWSLLESTDLQALELMEGFAEGTVSGEEFAASIRPSWNGRNSAQAAARQGVTHAVRLDLRAATLYAALAAGNDAADSPGMEVDWGAGRDAFVRRERLRQVILLRDIIGNPFRGAVVSPAWLAWNDHTVPRLAEAIYEGRSFEDVPVLADALEEAGCTDTDVLAHCHGSGPHVRGCFVLDLLLGKE